MLLVSQVAMAVMLVVGAGLLMRSYRALRAVEPGIEPAGVLTLRISLPRQYDSLPFMWRFYDDLVRRVQDLPGVSAAGVSWSLPFTGTYGCTGQTFEDAAVQAHLREIGSTTCADMAPASPGYFDALGIPLLAGRGFTAADNDQPERGAVVVSRAFAERFWPGQDPIGKGVRPFGRAGPPWYRVVGVVGDLHTESLDGPPATAIYYPVVAIPGTPRWWPGTMFLVVRSDRADAATLLPEVRAIVRAADPAIPLANAETMQAIVDRSMSRLSFVLLLLGVSAAAALLLAAIGLYGVVSYLVARRTGEIGVRIALGALPGQVGRLVMTRSLLLTLAGVAVGLAGAIGLTRVLSGLLYGVRPVDPLSFAGAALMLAAVALVAAWLPARRAANMDPVEALRQE
jgi:predicted permease